MNFTRLIALLTALVIIFSGVCEGATAPAKKKTAQKNQWPAPPPPGATITMDDTIYGVLRTHRALRSMQENRNVLTHEVHRAQAAFGPSIDATGKAGWSLLSDRTTRDYDLDKQMYTYGEISARLTQPIWDGFATRSRVRSAKSTLESVKHRVFDTATTLSLDGIIAQIDLLRRRTLYELAERNVETHRTIVAQTEERSSMGADTEADVTQARSRMVRAMSTLSEAQAALLVAEDTYRRLTGMLPSKKMQPITMPPKTYSGPKEVYEIAEKDNPKLAAYLQDIRVQRAEKQLSKSTYYPHFQVEVGPTYSDRGGSPDRWVYSFDALGVMRWNVFNSGMDLEETRAAAARVRQARQTMYDFADDLRLDIETTWINYLSAQDQYKNYSEAIKYNEFTRAAYMEQFQMGKRSLLDVLDAENELYNSSTQAETARGNILVGAYRLCALTGNLLKILNINLEPLEESPPRDVRDQREVFEPGWFK